MPGSELPPKGWSGWPDGKRFAFVLTHDVERSDGVEQCERLMALEMKLGFRSSFNFIPEGGYRVPQNLRDRLTGNGFEIGVHDLHHDGKLYNNRQEFTKKAGRINGYLKDWHAVGFRSGFMLHNLDWIGDLELLYDASTFDTDPFEPHPDGVETIFPFWVPRQRTLGSKLATPNGDHGYVELPYTLPQDSTLYLVLRERTPEIWLRKLDWIAQHGGMALVNVHPDYIQFPGQQASPGKFPIAHYEQLLKYVRGKYGDCVWQPLPKELAAWYRSQLSSCDSRRKSEPAAAVLSSDAKRPSPRLTGKRAAVVLYGSFPSDARPRYELQALLDEGASVDLICLPEDPAQPKEEVRERLRITRFPISHTRSSKGSYVRNYASFFLRSFFTLTARTLRNRYDLIHVHNMPDALVFSAIVPRLFGAKIILDLHDPMPELYQTIFGLESNALLVRALKLVEKWSIRFSDVTLTPNEAFRKLFCSRSGQPSKVQIVMNTPDEAVFNPTASVPSAPSSAGANSHFRLMYHGTIIERHGLLTAIKAIKILSATLPGLVLEIYGANNDHTQEILQEAKKMGLDGRIRYCGMRKLDDIPAAIMQADLGIIPNRRTPFTEINFPTRIFEYLCMGKPVIAPKTIGIQDYFDETNIVFFEPDNPEDLARAIRWVYEHAEETASFIERGRDIYRQHHWCREKSKLLDIVRSLLL